MAALTVNQIVPAGVVSTLVAAAAGGDSFPNDGRTFFIINNGGGGSVTVTFTPQAKAQGETITPRAVVVTAGQRQNIGPFDTGIFNDANGAVAVTYSGVTTVTVGAYRL